MRFTLILPILALLSAPAVADNEPQQRSLTSAVLKDVMDTMTNSLLDDTDEEVVEDRPASLRGNADQADRHLSTIARERAKRRNSDDAEDGDDEDESKSKSVSRSRSHSRSRSRSRSRESHSDTKRHRRSDDERKDKDTDEAGMKKLVKQVVEAIDKKIDKTVQKQIKDELEKEQRADQAKDVIADTLTVDKSKLTRDADIYNDLAADELDKVNLMMDLEDAFDTEIDEETADKLKTVGDVMDFVEKDAQKKKKKKKEREERVNKAKDVIADTLTVDVKKVTPDASFTNDLGADDLDKVELVMALEEAFDKEIDSEKVHTVGDVLDIIG